MSDAVSALNGVSFEGRVSVTDIGPRGMITLRGDLASAAVKKAVKAVTGTAVPGQREVLISGDQASAWMSPDELLLMTPHGETSAAIEAANNALGKTHSLVVEVSDARAVFAVEGDDARETLAKLLPVDLSYGSFAPGQIRRSHIAQVPAAIWMTDENRFELVCFRSVARYVFDLLRSAGGEGGHVGIWSSNAQSQ